jgi:hypothetical protein
MTGHAYHDVYCPCWAIEVRNRPDRRRFDREDHKVHPALSELEGKERVSEIYGRKAFSRMLTAQEKMAAEKKEAEKTIVQVDDLLVFRQFSKKMPLM